MHVIQIKVYFFGNQQIRDKIRKGESDKKVPTSRYRRKVSGSKQTRQGILK